MERQIKSAPGPHQIFLTAKRPPTIPRSWGDPEGGTHGIAHLQTKPRSIGVILQTSETRALSRRSTGRGRVDGELPGLTKHWERFRAFGHDVPVEPQTVTLKWIDWGRRRAARLALTLLRRDASRFASRGSTKPPMRGFVRSLKRQRGEVAMPRQVDEVALRPGSIRALGDDP